MLKQVGNTTVFVKDKYINHFTPTPRPLPARQAHATSSPALDIYRLFRSPASHAGAAPAPSKERT